MLVSYSVENYKVFKEKQTLYMIPIKKYSSKHLLENLIQTNNKEVPELLKGICIYGANASGKTKLLESVFNFWSVISYFRQANEFLPYYKFIFDKENDNKPTNYKIEFLLNNSFYKYNLSFNQTRIVSESLEKDDKKIYSINTESENKNFFEKKIFKKFLPESYIKMKNRGFVNPFIIEVVNNAETDFFNDIVIFFLNRIKIRTVANCNSQITLNLLNSTNENNKNKENIIAIIQKANPKIKNYSNGMYVYDNGIIIPREEESKGTQLMFNLAGEFLTVLKNGGVLFVDELDESIHPDLFIEIVKMFHDNNINTGNAQLIFTAHNDILLEKEYNLFRRDQIYFMQKNNNKGELIPLTCFNGVKKRDNIVKLYREGYFGARNIMEEFYLR